jgi:hypothetical protein
MQACGREEATLADCFAEILAAVKRRSSEYLLATLTGVP